MKHYTKNLIEIGKLYQTKGGCAFYKCRESNVIVYTNHLMIGTLIMSLENNCYGRYSKVITEDGIVGYIDSTYHHQNSGTIEKVC